MNLQPSPKAQARALDTRIAASARAMGMTVARYRDQFNRTVLIESLERAIMGGVIETYLIKGAAAIEIRFGNVARATQDFDLELPVTLEYLEETFKRVLEIGCEKFSFLANRNVRPVRDSALQLSVAMRYCGQPWATIDVDLAPMAFNEAGTSVEVSSPELRIVAQAKTMRIEYLIAQKIHAALTPDKANYKFDYARHVVDVLFLVGSGVDLGAVRAACHAVFDLRSIGDGRRWPPENVALPDRWLSNYQATIDLYADLALTAAQVPNAFTTILTSIVGGFVTMPGYQYHFVVLEIHNDSTVGAATPIKTSGMAYEGFTNLTRDGWRVRSSMTMTRADRPLELLLILEREIVDEALTPAPAAQV